MGNRIRLLFLVLLALIQACAAQTVVEDVPKQIIAALQAGRYADAIIAARQGQASLAEIDFAVGEIILQGWSDTAPSQRPSETLEQGIALLEKSALTGHTQAIASLAALFFTGLSQGDVKLIAPDGKLRSCWKALENGVGNGAACVAIRRK